MCYALCAIFSHNYRNSKNLGVLQHPQAPTCLWPCSWTVSLVGLPCLLVHASVNSVASFHAVMATGCLFGQLVRLSYLVQAAQPKTP